MSCYFLVSNGPTKDEKTRFSLEINCFKVLWRIESVLPHYTKTPLKQLIRHNSMQDEFSISNQIKSAKLQKVRTKGQSEILSRFVPKKPTIFLLDCCRQRHFCPD